MLRSALSRRLLAALLGMLALLFSPPSASADNPLEEKLDKPIGLDKPIDKTPLKDVLEFLSDHYDVRITIDKEAFKNQLKAANVETLPTRLPRLGMVNLGFVLRILASQVQGTYAVKADHIEIVPLAKGKKPAKRESKLLHEAAEQTREKLKKPITLEKGIDANTPLKDVVEFLSDRFDFALIIDVGTFHHQSNIKNIEELPVRLQAQ